MLQPATNFLRPAAALALLLLLVLLPTTTTAFSASTLTSLTPQNPPPPKGEMSGGITPREFLRERLPGPYTCLRARDGALLGFDFHMQRLMHAIRASGSSGNKVEEKEVRVQVLDAIREALEDAALLGRREESRDSKPTSTPIDAFVTVHAAVSSSSFSSSSLNLVLSAHALPMPYAIMPPPITLEVRGEGRQNPEIKHSKWIWDRQELERFRLGPGGEVALSRPCGKGWDREVLEGLVSNIFAIKGGKLLTAKDGVLPGHMRAMALEAARALGVPVGDTNECLRLEEVGEWEEAFLTGSGRVLVPIRRVEGTSVGLSGVDLPAAPGPVTNLLRARLLFDMEEGWEGMEELRKG